MGCSVFVKRPIHWRHWACTLCTLTPKDPAAPCTNLLCRSHQIRRCGLEKTLHSIVRGPGPMRCALPVRPWTTVAGASAPAGRSRKIHLCKYPESAAIPAFALFLISLIAFYFSFVVLLISTSWNAFLRIASFPLYSIKLCQSFSFI